MIHSTALESYRRRFQTLKQGNTPHGRAPHKPILLLSVIQQIEKGHITNNRIYLTADLVSAFVETFKLLVRTDNRAEFSLPFYHLINEKFWHLQPKSDQILRGYVKSINVLNDIIDCAYFDTPLFDLLFENSTRQILKNTLLDTYFPETKALYYAAQPDTDAYLLNIENQLLNEPNTLYQASPSLKNEEEEFVRGSLFKRMIPRLYNQTCSISRMRIQSVHGYQLIDACHIKPISLSNDDTVSNGFALSPTLHRAFDRGIIGIDTNYRVQISRYITEDETKSYSLQKLKGVSLFLPTNKTHYPAIENFGWHLKHRFEK
jgi:putative restriction endonuclease